MPERQKIALFNQQELEGKTVRGERYKKLMIH
jgi:hypothetical protein